MILEIPLVSVPAEEVLSLLVNYFLSSYDAHTSPQKMCDRHPRSRDASAYVLCSGPFGGILILLPYVKCAAFRTDL